MTRLEILQALQSGRMALEDAKKALAAIEAQVQPEDFGLVVAGVGGVEAARLSPWTVAPPSPGDITIQVRASALNYPDVMCVRGLYPTMPEYPFVPGFEVAGVVSAVGPGVACFAVGDEVIAVTGPLLGGHASKVNVPADNAVRKPATLTFEEACSLPVVFSTVYYAFEMGKLAEGEHVLVQTATGGCGLMALQLAHLKRCICHGSSSRDDKRKVLERIGVPHVIDYTGDFAPEIRNQTGGRGVDVVLNMVSGEAIQKGLDSLAPFGRYLEIAVHALKTSPKLDLSRLVQNQTLHSIDLRRVGFAGRLGAHRLLDEMAAMASAGEIVPIVSRVYPVRKLQDALQYVSEGKHIGKVVLSHTAEEVVDRTEACIEAMVRHRKRFESSAPSKPTVPVSPPELRTERPVTQDLEPVAVIGMAGKFPRASDLAQFWQNIARGVDCISEVPAGRWSVAEHYDADGNTPGKSYSKWLGVLEDAESFDPLFFGISPAEAERMDPQQRLFLEACWHCIEDAAIRPSSLSDTRCGVFVGCGPTDYGRDLRGGDLNAQALMGGATSILAARISYLLNLKGPCLAIETACSSSLVAISQACDSLALRNCDLALAGGVNVAFGPAMHIMSSDAGMLSKDGRCFTFDARANGFVPGEGVGVLLLKRLSDAVRDDDPIAGVIRGWGVNQDGKTNGITAPSAKSQAALEREVYRRFGIDADTISLVEAHGTGTRLGDPIEVEALVESFREHSARKHYCALGSVKSNIGHLMTAAGVSGVLKVLMAMRHQSLPPTLHFEAVNPHLALEGSPFYVNTELKPWTGVPVRRACVSSFGFSGTNAHVVLEEAPSHPRTVAGDAVSPAAPVVFTLSARTEVQLKELARSMAAFISATPDVDLRDLTYTLQVGREMLEHRLAILAGSREVLQEALAAYLAGRPSAAVLSGQAKRTAASISALAADEDGRVLFESWLHKGKLRRVADLWTQGVDVDWRWLYATHTPRRLRLPGYPFSKKRYSPPVVEAQAVSTVGGGAVLHPLVHRNSSVLAEQRYSSTFRGDAFFLADHQVNGRKVLPAAAYLEMARFAASDAWADEAVGRIPVLRNVVWTSPLVVDDAAEVGVALHAQDAGRLTFEVHSAPDAAGARTVHCRGLAELQERVAPRHDLRRLEADCPLRVLSREQCYETFARLGLNYGPGHRALVRVRVGHGQALGEVELPEHLVGDGRSFVLHPALVDSALQAAVGVLGDEGGTTPALPFAVEEVVVHGPCIPRMWAVVRSGTGEGMARKLDVDLCDEQGAVRVSIHALSLRPLPEQPSASVATGLFQMEWVPRELPAGDAGTFEHRVVVLFGMQGVDVAQLSSRLDGAECVAVDASHASVADRFLHASAQLLGVLQRVTTSRLSGKALVQLVAASGADLLLHGLSGMLKTAALEDDKIVGQTVLLAHPAPSIDQMVEVLRNEARGLGSNSVRYDEGRRLLATWKARSTDAVATASWPDSGVYVISGGAGRLGLRVAEEIAQRARGASIVLVGRSAPTSEVTARIDRIAGTGTQVVYRQADVGDLTAVDALVREVRSAFGPIKAVVHAAGLLRDRYLRDKTSEELQAVAWPKVRGIVNLDLATRGEPLELFLVFSSIAGAIGNIGQADYAAANAFMDGYAANRDALVRTGERTGRTLSVNWPFWEEGGMQVDAATAKRMVREWGLAALSSTQAFDALYRGLRTDAAQLMVLSGHLEAIQRRLTLSEEGGARRAATGAARAVTIDDDTLRTQVRQVLMSVVSKVLKIPFEELDADAELKEMGFDSISLTDLAHQLAGEYRLDLTPTVFFEHPTINALVGRLVSEHRPLLAERHRGVAGPVADTSPEDTLPTPPVSRRSGRRSPGFSPAAVAKVPGQREPVAVVGMSGAFPGAPDLATFWRNLAAGRDCIEEIPADRWNWRDYFGDPAAEDNKTRIRHGGFIEGVGEFDPLFFGISPSEAEIMDPQQRLLMTHVWRAIEDSGHAPQSLAGSNTAIFVGTGNTGYASLLERSGVAIKGSTATGSVPSVGPNRLSYLLDLHGPSEPIETACSSSLVAVHRALLAIELGLCDAALVGGVNTIVTPDAHIGFGKAGMLSEDGRCKTFARGADGYVRGEGVGVLYLKRLSLAERDGDHIYGLLLGSAENHGGRANSLTAPNPKAQADLIEAAWLRAGVDPRTAGYIEAHGTGTSLGDPVEINGLKSAFHSLYEKTGAAEGTDAHIGIGSVKSNIGHLELAAGVAGLVKVLLQMRHGVLAKSLHCEELNPYIELKGSPFYVVQEGRPWLALKDASGRPLPRRAGVSSFGFGGVNAHVVVEEYVPSHEATPTPLRGPAICVLSARTEEQLRQQARQLHEAVEREGYRDEHLPALAYTLQVGRDAMEERLALLVDSIAGLQEKLRAFVDGAGAGDAVFRGHVKRSKDALSVFTGDDDLQEAIASWLSKGKYHKLLDLWTKGLSFDWNRLYGAQRPQRLSLPTYPFSRTRYWVPEGEQPAGAPTWGALRAGGVDALHPLLRRNVSDLRQQGYEAVFSANQFFLADHVILGKRVVPGVVYLEMARAALQLAEGEDAAVVRPVRVTNVTWPQPQVVEGPTTELRVSLFPEDDGRVRFDIHSGSDDTHVCHSQGLVTSFEPKPAAAVDVAALKSQCQRGELSAEQCYQAFASLGAAYGPGHRALRAVYQGVDQVLARLVLPEGLGSAVAPYVLHPSLMDAALQATIGLSAQESPAPVGLPFSVDAVEVLAPCPPQLWVWIRNAAGSTAGGAVRKLDLDLLADDGHVCIRLKGFLMRPVKELRAAPAPRILAPEEEVDASPADAGPEGDASSVRDQIRSVLITEVARAVKVSAGDIEINTEFSEYGFDSISLTEFTSRLNHGYGLSLTPTLFFELPTIAALSEHLAEKYRQNFDRYMVVAKRGADSGNTPAPTKAVGPKAEARRLRRMPRPSRSAEPLTYGNAEPLAVIGMSGRFPMAEDLEAYWRNLRDGVDCIQEIPASRWDWREIYGDANQEPGKTLIKWGGFIDGIDEFDPLFFGVSPSEAELMDPQQRLLMTYVWLAMEDAGYSASSLSGTRTALFIGTGQAGYGSLIEQANAEIKSYASTAAVPSVGPNRMSYFLNIKGPSEPIETACSSSLVAVHKAMLAIHRGECDTAIVGGVNTLPTPAGHIGFDKAGMLSPDGRCKTFSDQANGYVRGEGVGMLMLKRLSLAEADGDHIYGVIRGSAAGHGGRTNSPTAPSPKSQAELLHATYTQAGIDPRTVTFIEAHGTGTSLGDPIEIDGLKSAFTALDPTLGAGPVDRAFCGLGSVKTNIGHLELAAGVAGVIKVLLQMKHKTLAKSLHSQQLNRHIHLDGSPFFIVRETQPWPALEDGAGNVVPRRAGVSSFGIGGVNAHVVVEEYLPSSAPAAEVLQDAPHLIVLSAKNEARLIERARQLLHAVEQGEVSQADLPSVAYTLQVGRDAMEERLGLLARSLEELKEKLLGFTEGRGLADGVYRGHVKRHKEFLSVFADDAEMQEAVAKWMARGKLSKVLEVWTRGMPVDWAKLHGGAQLRRRSLPTYPFAKEKYWVAKPARAENRVRAGSRAALHPLVHENSSDLRGQRYSAHLTGEEFFLRDHVVGQDKVLPGVAFLEMARAAVVNASGPTPPGKVTLRNVVWSRPIIVTDAPVQVHIGLEAEQDGSVVFEIYGGTDEAPLLFCQGRARIGAGTDEEATAPCVDLSVLQSGCQDRRQSGAAVYQTFASAGLTYGPTLRALQELSVGRGQVLARAVLPEQVLSSQGQFVLHPSLLDAALQAALGLHSDEGGQLSLPFALDALEVWDGPAPSDVWIHLRDETDGAAGTNRQKISISLCDRDGKVWVRLKGFSTRPVPAAGVRAGAENHVLLFAPIWEETALASAPITAARRRVLVFCGATSAVAEAAANRIQGAQKVVMGTSAASAPERFRELVQKLFEAIKGMALQAGREATLLQCVVSTEDTERDSLRGLLGLFKTARLEHPALQLQLVEVDAPTDVERVVARLQSSSTAPELPHLLFQDEKVLVTRWRELTAPAPEAPLWRKGGTYLITGGAGGLGKRFAQTIVEATEQASIVLTGRSPAGDAQRAFMESLRRPGVRVEYRPCDVTRAEDCQALIAWVRDTFGGLNGILHAAGVIEDSLLKNKDWEAWERVLAPKVQGLTCLDEASRSERLDFFVMFSSFAGAIGNPGQSDYAAANAYMDAYARQREARVARGERFGNTLSINWPLWREGGMHVDAATEQMMTHATGMAVLETTAGVQAFQHALAHAQSQVMVLAGQAERIRKWLGRGGLLEGTSVSPSPSASATSSTAEPGDEVRARVSAMLCSEIAAVLKVDAAAVDADSELSEYGFDSITLTEFANRLNRAYELDLTPPVLFEYPSVDTLAGYLLRAHRESMVRHFGEQERGATPEVVSLAERMPAAEPVTSALRTRERRGGSRGRSVEPARTDAPSTSTPARRGPTPLAVVGMSGCFPGARDLEQFWTNLAGGVDSITEVPPSRWDWRELYGDPRKEGNKTKVKWGGFIEGVEEFDPLFFGISPVEAEVMDPQQRLLMMHVWRAIEDAGYAPHSLSGTRTGIFVGTGITGYNSLVERANLAIQGYSSTAVVPSIGPNRMSYLLNLHGPSEPVETACSSSLVALHRAMEAIDSGSCDMALAGGVNTIVTPGGHIAFDKAGMLSEDGRCKTFSAAANGYVRGEGVGVVFLKRLADAERDGDPIYGVIRSSAENHGGRANSLTAPNPNAQSQLLQDAYRKADIDPRTIGYVEAHGTGTELGDPVEVNGLKNAFAAQIEARGGGTSLEKHCGLGSVKSNIGHLELAAGMAGVIKVLLQMKHRKLVKTLHCERLNPYIQLEDSPFFIVQQTQDWPALMDERGQPLPRRAGVSSFGFGGVNAHVVMEEYLGNARANAAKADVPRGPVAIVLSAKNAERLREQAAQLLDAARSGRWSDAELPSLAYTLQVGREAMEERLAMVVDSLAALETRLQVFLTGGGEGLFVGGRAGRAHPSGKGSAEAEAAVRGAVTAWKAGDASPLLGLWATGGTVDWTQLYAAPLSRTHVPAYPFARERYWIAPAPPQEQQTFEKSVAQKRPSLIGQLRTRIGAAAIEGETVND
ncbi:SDR family NAD(P)-dependent oxidoreductase [Myxococcus xanthus]|uniref:SDR family NAD(P)-dependent oxidoreductase n=1 Tax=Myxococcus xanthus TaxID=34 RepID=UPI001CED8E28|nr:SDR family NAD(P)-dependent oxidoreductase [Myxococcus xanthus]